MWGGAIYNAPLGKLRIEDSAFLDNGVRAESLTSPTYLDAVCKDCAGGGGHIWNDSGLVEILRSSFAYSPDAISPQSNAAGWDGGHITSIDGFLQIQDTTFTNGLGNRGGMVFIGSLAAVPIYSTSTSLTYTPRQRAIPAVINGSFVAGSGSFGYPAAETVLAGTAFDPEYAYTVPDPELDTQHQQQQQQEHRIVPQLLLQRVNFTGAIAVCGAAVFATGDVSLVINGSVFQQGIADEKWASIIDTSGDLDSTMHFQKGVAGEGYGGSIMVVRGSLRPTDPCTCATAMTGTAAATDEPSEGILDNSTTTTTTTTLALVRFSLGLWGCGFIFIQNVCVCCFLKSFYLPRNGFFFMICLP